MQHNLGGLLRGGVQLARTVYVIQRGILGKAAVILVTGRLIKKGVQL